jgi:hypothetical protein
MGDRGPSSCGSTIDQIGGKCYLHAMPSQPIELPPDVALSFVQDMRAFFAAPNTLKQDEIAAARFGRSTRTAGRVLIEAYVSSHHPDSAIRLVNDGLACCKLPNRHLQRSAREKRIGFDDRRCRRRDSCAPSPGRGALACHSLRDRLSLARAFRMGSLPLQ